MPTATELDFGAAPNYFSAHLDIFISVFLALVIRPCLHLTILQSRRRRRRRWCSSSSLLWIRGRNNTLTLAHSSSSTLVPNTTPRALTTMGPAAAALSSICHYYGDTIYTQMHQRTNTHFHNSSSSSSRGSHLNLATEGSNGTNPKSLYCIEEILNAIFRPRSEPFPVNSIATALAGPSRTTCTNFRPGPNARETPFAKNFSPVPCRSA